MTESSPEQSLADRVARLEASIRVMQQSLESLHATPASRSTESAKPVPPGPPASPVPPRTQPFPPPVVAQPFPPRVNQQLSPWDRMPEQMKSWEYWLNKLGIGLLLFGVLFLFKYSIDRGWITPAVRVACGIGLGAVLIGLGLRLYDKRRQFATVLLGGGIATFYITGFASFQFLEIWPFTVAFSFMIATTLLSFILSLKQDEAVLSLIALAGGLGTPFLLYTGQGSLPGLILYTCMLLALSGGIYFYKGWQALLWETIIGGWIVLFIGEFSSYEGLAPVGPSSLEMWSLQGGYLFAFLMFWMVPLVREIFLIKFPARLTPERLGILDQRITPRTTHMVSGHVHLWTVTTPIIAYSRSMAVWNLGDHAWGWLALAVAAVLIAVWGLIRTTPQLARLGYTHLLTGLVFVTVGLALLLEGDVLFITLAAEAAVLVMVGHKTNFQPLRIYGHVLFVLVGLWFFIDRMADTNHEQFWTASTIADLFGVLALMAAAVASGKIARQLYIVAAAVLLAVIWQRELDGNLLMVLLGIELFGFHFIAGRSKEDSLRVVGDFFSVGVGLMLCYRLFLQPAVGISFLNWAAATDLIAIAVFLGIGMIHRQEQARFVYRVAMHAAVLVLLWKELSPLTNGDGIVSVAWGVYGVVMLVLGLRKNIYRLRLVGLLTLLLTVGKLFMVDLARIETIWRILLFLGFGGIFLLLSYYFRALWKPPTAPESDSSAAGPQG